MVSVKKVIGYTVLYAASFMIGWGAGELAWGADKKMSAEEISFMATEMYQANNSVCAKAAHNDELITGGLNSLMDNGMSTTIPVLQTLIYEKCMYQMYLNNFAADSEKVVVE